MHIESIKNQKIDNFTIVELRLRGKKIELEKFFADIQEDFSLAHDEWSESSNALTMTFDSVPKVQTVNIIRQYTNSYIKELEMIKS